MPDGASIREFSTAELSIAEIASELRPPILRRFANEAAQVARIVADVAERGDGAVLEYTRALDWPDASVERFEVPPAEMEVAAKAITSEQRDALELACKAVREFHEQSRPRSWLRRSEDRALGQRWSPLRRVGICVPGGLPLPSSLYMCVVPARVAGVDEIVVVTSSRRDGSVHALTLAAARLAGVDRLFRVGGAHAVAALAFGTQTIPRVDKIVGPGSIYVALAKREVFGQVGIESLPGPSDITVISDGSAPAAWIAADMLSQAEHGAESSAILCTPCHRHLAEVRDEIARQVALLPRKGHAAQSLARRGALVLCRDLEECATMADAIAPEHLEIAVDVGAEELAERIRCAGAIFLGPYTPEPVGDYVAGPSHVLPTEGTARYASPLGVEDFMRRTSIVRYDRPALEREARHIVALAEAEELMAHARSAAIRLE